MVERFEIFRIWYTTKYLQLISDVYLTYLGTYRTLYLGFFFLIGDLRSGQFRDLPQGRTQGGGPGARALPLGPKKH